MKRLYDLSARAYLRELGGQLVRAAEDPDPRVVSLAIALVDLQGRYPRLGDEPFNLSQAEMETEW